MFRIKLLRSAVVVSVLAGVLLPGTAARGAFTVFSVGGDATIASIQPTVDAFRAAIGGSNNGDGPSTLGGRREVNWDGGATAEMSGNFLTEFRNTRGIQIFANTSGLWQTPPDDPAFTSINPSYATKFSAFSPNRVLTTIGGSGSSPQLSVEFFTPGTNGMGSAVSAFGAVFSDVDRFSSNISLMFYNLSDFQNPVAWLFVPPGTVPEGSLSFVGLVGDANEKIGHIIIHAGDVPPNSGAEDPMTFSDVIVMDDFIYAEPQIPEPSSVLLALAGGGAAASLRRR